MKREREGEKETEGYSSAVCIMGRHRRVDAAQPAIGTVVTKEQGHVKSCANIEASPHHGHTPVTMANR